VKTISANYPKSWFSEIGRYKLLKDLTPKLPNVEGGLFVTLTTDPKLFASPESAFEHSRDRIRRLMFKLRRGVTWKGQKVKIAAPYFVKVEFHKNDWAHFHIIFLTRRHLSGDLLNSLWGYGRTNVKRINNETFHYLLKYVTKNCDLPEWLKERSRIRIIQPSRGFYVSENKEAPFPRSRNRETDEYPTRNELPNIGERISCWEHSALVTGYSKDGKIVSRRVERLKKSFKEIFEENFYDFAEEQSYLGNGTVVLYQGSVFLENIK